MEMERGVGKTGKQRCGSSGGTDLKVSWVRVGES